MVKPQYVGSITITYDGSVVGTNKIQRDGNIYTLTGNISGVIQVQRSNITIDGSGYTIEGNGASPGIDLTNGIGQNYSRPTISNVTIENLRITNTGIATNGGGNYTFYGVYIACSVNNTFGIWLSACSHNLITYCTFDGCQISMDYGANDNTVTENNFINVKGYLGILVWLSQGETVDRNYWSDYLTRYPAATEIDSTGIGSIPYDYGGSLGSYYDNNPLMKPVKFPEFPSPSPTSPSPSPSSGPSSLSPSPTQSSSLPPSPTTWMIATMIIAIAIATAVILVYFRKRNHKTRLCSIFLSHASSNV
jgi:hypothetical protein